jgi:hypothetical protein
LLQWGIFLLSFGRVTGRRSRVHGGEWRLDPAMKCMKFLSELFRRKKPPVVRKSYGGSSEMMKLLWRR